MFSVFVVGGGETGHVILETGAKHSSTSTGTISGMSISLNQPDPPHFLSSLYLVLFIFTLLFI